MKARAVVLLSGGLDSAVALYYALKNGYECRPLTFDYGQRHACEIECAKLLSKALRLESKILKLSMPWIESGLFGENMLPEGYGNYIPGRNTIFLSIAASFAETIGASTVFIGANAGDADNYPDCRRDYLDGFNALLTMGTKKGGKGELRIERPFIDRDKSEIIRLGHSLGVPFQHTVSCYNGGVKPCMKCEACVKRRDGFKAAGIDDPLVVRHTEFTVSV